MNTCFQVLGNEITQQRVWHTAGATQRPALFPPHTLVGVWLNSEESGIWKYTEQDRPWVVKGQRAVVKDVGRNPNHALPDPQFSLHWA